MKLTEKKDELLSQIACDNETGNHLLGRKRSEEYWQMRKEWAEAMKAEERTERQILLLEYVHQCTDYAYYHSLPTEKRML